MGGIIKLPKYAAVHTDWHLCSIPEVNSESKLSALENMSICSYMKGKDNPTASSDK